MLQEEYIQQITNVTQHLEKEGFRDETSDEYNRNGINPDSGHIRDRQFAEKWIQRRIKVKSTRPETVLRQELIEKGVDSRNSRTG